MESEGCYETEITCSSIHRNHIIRMFNYSREFFRKRKGSMELLTPTITAKDNELEIKTKGIDENKVTFIYVANKKCWNKN